MATLLLLVGMAVYLVKPGPPRFMVVFGDSLPVAAAAFAFLSAVATAAAFGRGEPHRVVWTFLALGFFLFFLGESSWWISEAALGQEVPYPSMADLFWLTAYAPLFIGLILNFRLLDIRLDLKSLWPWLLLLVTVALVSVVFILLPVAAGPERLLAKVLSLLYPIEDVVILGAAFLTLTGLSYGALSRPWKIIAGGFVMMLVGDLIFLYLAGIDLYRTGNPIDLVWVAGYLAIGVGAVYEREIVS